MTTTTNTTAATTEHWTPQPDGVGCTHQYADDGLPATERTLCACDGCEVVGLDQDALSDGDRERLDGYGEALSEWRSLPRVAGASDGSGIPLCDDCQEDAEEHEHSVCEDCGTTARTVASVDCGMRGEMYLCAICAWVCVS